MKVYRLFRLSSILLASVILSSCQDRKSTDHHQIRSHEQAAYLATGKAIAKASFAALSGSLQTAMAEGGVPHAVEYCQLNAVPLIDSLSKANQAVIRRTSKRIRNPLNLPTNQEKVALEQFEQQLVSGEELVPMVEALDEQQLAFYAPIKVNAFCLQCHGKVGDTLSEEDYAVIKERYPMDKAVGYQDGDLRGMWSISFTRVQEQ